MHDFAQSLAMSHRASDWPGWEPLYRRFFPTLSAVVDHRADGEHQRAGIDRSLTLENSKQILIDEKVRGRNRKTGQVYEDILLEYVSDEERRTPGWVNKPLRADFIAYLIAPLGKAYLLPVPALQLAWRDHAGKWISEYRAIRAQNPGWITLSVAVPVDVLFRAVGQALRSRFESFETEE